MTGDPSLLARRWPLAATQEWPRRLLEAWAAPERGYHDLLHLREVLDRLDELAAADVSFDALPVQLAGWFHDAVYDGESAPEERSAELAHAVLAELGHGDLASEVARLVLLTVAHRTSPEDLNGAALIDADLAILASAPQRYASYVAGVRREYAHVSDREFATGRLTVLEALAAGPLFLTDHGQRAWAPAARANLTTEIASLREAQAGPA